MKALLKKFVKSVIIDKPAIVYTKMTLSSSSPSMFVMGGSTNGPKRNISFSGNNNHRQPPSCCSFRIPIRFLILSLIVMATSIDYITRVNINIAIVTMVKQNSSHNDIHGQECPFPEDEAYSIAKEIPKKSLLSSSLNSSSIPSSTPRIIRPEEEVNRFNWSPTTQGVILGSFWYAYIIMQVPSGRLAETVGGKTIVTISLVGSGIINLLTPFFARHSTFVLIMSRMALGFVQGGIFPSCYAMIGKWFPRHERSLGFAFMEIGATIGSVMATTSAGYLSEHGFSGGWPSVFYVSGIISLLSFFAWYNWTESSPDEYEGMPEDEIRYIKGGEEGIKRGRTIGMSGISSPSSSVLSSSSTSGSISDSSFVVCEKGDDGRKSTGEASSSSSPEQLERGNVQLHKSPQHSGGRSTPTSSVRVPWGEIFTSPPVLAVMVSKFCLGWAYFTLLSKLPAYLHDVLHVPPTENGLLNASLYMTTCISLLSSSHISERLINEKVLSRTTCRKIFLSIAVFGAAGCFMFVPYAGCDTNSAMIILLLGNFLMGFNAGGDVPVAGEMTSNFPATIYAIGNMCGCTTGFLSPYVVGVILESKEAHDNLIGLWSQIFFLSAAIAIFGALIFISFASATKQPWDNIPEDVQTIIEDEEDQECHIGHSKNSTTSYASCD